VLLRSTCRDIHARVAHGVRASSPTFDSEELPRADTGIKLEEGFQSMPDMLHESDQKHTANLMCRTID
jgi:hypothetical protein